MELLPPLALLAEQTVSGIVFVTAYGLTWLICGFFWHRASARTAAYTTPFQGVVAFPLALGGSALIGTIAQGRPSRMRSPSCRRSSAHPSSWGCRSSSSSP